MIILIDSLLTFQFDFLHLLNIFSFHSFLSLLLDLFLTLLSHVVLGGRLFLDSLPFFLYFVFPTVFLHFLLDCLVGFHTFLIYLLLLLNFPLNFGQLLTVQAFFEGGVSVIVVLIACFGGHLLYCINDFKLVLAYVG